MSMFSLGVTLLAIHLEKGKNMAAKLALKYCYDFLALWQFGEESIRSWQSDCWKINFSWKTLIFVKYTVQYPHLHRTAKKRVSRNNIHLWLRVWIFESCRSRMASEEDCWAVKSAAYEFHGCGNCVPFKELWSQSLAFWSMMSLCSLCSTQKGVHPHTNKLFFCWCCLGSPAC